MTAELWIDDDTTIDLGGTISLYMAFADMRNAAGAGYLKQWPNLFGVLTQVEWQTNADPDWLRDMSKEATEFFAKYANSVDDPTRWVLLQLSQKNNESTPTKSIRKAAGTCKPGERADLTGCTPRSGQASSKPTNSLPSRSSRIASATWQQLQKPITRGGIVAAAKSIPGGIGHLEHIGKEWTSLFAAAAFKRLPAPVKPAVQATWLAARVGTKAAFVTYATGQAAAERVAKQRGATPEQAARLRHALSALDVLAAKPVVIGLTALGLGAAALPASFIPVGSATYLAYSTARNPAATFRAAKDTVASLVGKVRGKKSKDQDDELVLSIFEQLAKAEDGDRWLALFLAALDATGDVRKAVRVVEMAVKGKK